MFPQAPHFRPPYAQAYAAPQQARIPQQYPQHPQLVPVQYAQYAQVAGPQAYHQPQYPQPYNPAAYAATANAYTPYGPPAKRQKANPMPHAAMASAYQQPVPHAQPYRNPSMSQPTSALSASTPAASRPTFEQWAATAVVQPPQQAASQVPSVSRFQPQPQSTPNPFQPPQPPHPIQTHRPSLTPSVNQTSRAPTPTVSVTAPLPPSASAKRTFSQTRILSAGSQDLQNDSNDAFEVDFDSSELYTAFEVDITEAQGPLSLGIITWHPPRMAMTPLPSLHSEAEIQATSPIVARPGEDESISQYFVNSTLQDSLGSVRLSLRWAEVQHDLIYRQFQSTSDGIPITALATKCRMRGDAGLPIGVDSPREVKLEHEQQEVTNGHDQPAKEPDDEAMEMTSDDDEPAVREPSVQKMHESNGLLDGLAQALGSADSAPVSHTGPAQDFYARRAAQHLGRHPDSRLIDGQGMSHLQRHASMSDMGQVVDSNHRHPPPPPLQHHVPQSPVHDPWNATQKDSPRSNESIHTAVASDFVMDDAEPYFVSQGMAIPPPPPPLKPLARTASARKRNFEETQDTGRRRQEDEETPRARRLRQKVEPAYSRR